MNEGSMPALSERQLEALRGVDSPTLANAIELLGVRHPTQGYMSREIRCYTPERGPMVGHAVTATIDNASPEALPHAQGVAAFFRALAAAPKPAVVVLQDVSGRPLHACHFGDIIATVCKRLGAVGAVSDGGFRDLDGIRQVGFHVFAAGLVPARGIYQWVDVNVPVRVGGLQVRPGDLLHGDANGLISAPGDAVDRALEAVASVRQKEQGRLDYANSPDFTLEGLLESLR